MSRSFKVKNLRGMVRKSYVHIAKNIHSTWISVMHSFEGAGSGSND